MFSQEAHDAILAEEQAEAAQHTADIDAMNAAAAATLRCNQNDTEGIRTPAGRAQWISSPSP